MNISWYMDAKEFSKNIALRMGERGDTQRRVSALTGVPQPAISRFLHGKSIGTRYTLALLEYLEKYPSPQGRKSTDASV